MMAVALLPSILLFLAAAGFWHAHTYELRWVVTVCVAGLCVGALRDSLLWLVVLLAILILFNPLYPVHVPRGTMRLMEAVAGICIMVRGLSRV
jgi:beta-lactamase regulating signal transducer with metallopeptidase domain